MIKFELKDAPRSGLFQKIVEEYMTQDHGKTKYDRVVKGAKADGTIDVYAVLLTFNVTCPARQHALKKLLCTGIRGKGSTLQDLKETKVAIERAIEIEEQANACGEADFSGRRPIVHG